MRNSVHPRQLAAAVLLGLFLAGGPSGAVFAYDERSTAAVNVDAAGLALRGYDPVSYFSGKPVQGVAAYTASYDGASYRFASARNRDQFKADPARYAPQYGGFCAMGVALGKKLDGDPEVWKVAGGKLYLNVNREVFAKWSQDVPGHVAEAEAEWPKIRHQAPDTL